MPRLALLAAIVGAALASAPATAQSAATAKLKTIVLVHGAFADGSGWREVYDRLTRDGYKVLVVQNPTTSFATDVQFTRNAIAMAQGDVVLVGHSYGGAVVTQAGNDPKVKALVYIAAFAPDQGESAFKLATRKVPGATPPPFMPPKDGFIILDPAKFAQAFAADVQPATSQFMAVSQVPWATAAANGVITQAAWHTRPVWAILTTEDHMIPPATQRMMTMRDKAHVTEVASSHAVFLSHPDEVTAIIERAAHGDPR